MQAIPRAGSQLEVALNGALVGWRKVQIVINWGDGDFVLGWVNYYRAQEPTPQFDALIDHVELESSYNEGAQGMDAA